uniref:Uncharacterized protein n=1 Tax=Anguilla anguilla TaxID=7936 RepID=A0A0E9XAT6_ANGAN
MLSLMLCEVGASK